jgi:hypothetical protein
MARAHYHRMPQPIFGEPVFNEDQVFADPSRFSIPHPSDNELYKAIEDLLRKQVVGFEPSRLKPNELFTLESALGAHARPVLDAIDQAGHIVFHAVGDTGASDVRKYRKELRVADQVTTDCYSAPTSDRPAFFFHLGDVVYNFGESAYYFDQFYDPYRNYPNPIIALAGNHDSFVVPGTPADEEPLKTFVRSFASEHPVVTPEAGSLHRTAMTQPGVYFTLDAPFVRIIGLFSNALEDPGVLSSEGGKWPAVPDLQLDFLEAQLQRVLDDKYQGAVLLATHHPSFTYAPPSTRPTRGDRHVSSTAMLRQIDAICKKAGVYPHAFLAAHSHNYQRYTRTVRLGGNDLQVPFIVCGSGGHNINPILQSRHEQPSQEPDVSDGGVDVSYLDIRPAVDSGGLSLIKYEDQNFGYLRISVDPRRLRIAFHTVTTGPLHQSRYDLVTVDLRSHTLDI